MAKLPSINCKQVAATPANKLDIKHGKLDAGKILLMATWEPEQKVGEFWVRLGKPTVTFWRAWKIRKKSIFGAGIRPKKTPEGFRLEWRSKEPFAPLAVETPAPAVKRPRRGSNAREKAIQLRSKRGLLPHQPAAVARHVRALEKHGGSLEASTTGVGKTFIALATARELDLRPAIVCPKNIISGWQEAAEALGVKPFFVSNYEQLKIGNLAPTITRCDHGSRLASFAWNLTGRQKRVMTIFDEAHRLTNQDSLNSALAVGCRNAGIPTMQLSATIAQDPTEMHTPGLLLNLHSGGQDFHRWAQEYGCLFDGMGLIWRGGDEHIQRLHEDLFPEHGSRIRGQDIKDFPESMVIAKSLDCEDTELLSRIYEKMDEEMTRHAEKLEMDGLKLLNSLLMMTRLRQQAELLKVPMIVELVRDLVGEGHSVPVFVNFTETLQALRQRLELGEVHLIHGQQTKKERDRNIALFQSNESRIILNQMKAGGESVSYHDKHGGYPRASVISPSFSAREVIQACGRTPRAGGKSKCLQFIVFAHGTIEDAACRQVQKKANNIERLNDGDLAAGFSIIKTTSKK